MVGPLGMPPWQAGLRAAPSKRHSLHRLAPRCTPGHANAVGEQHERHAHPHVQQRVQHKRPRLFSPAHVRGRGGIFRVHRDGTIQQLARRPHDHGHRRHQKHAKKHQQGVGATGGTGWVGESGHRVRHSHHGWHALCDGAVLLLGQGVFLWYSATHACTQASRQEPLALKVSGTVFLHRFNAACGCCSSWGRVGSKIFRPAWWQTARSFPGAAGASSVLREAVAAGAAWAGAAPVVGFRMACASEGAHGFS